MVEIWIKNINLAIKKELKLVFIFCIKDIFYFHYFYQDLYIAIE